MFPFSHRCPTVPQFPGVLKFQTAVAISRGGNKGFAKEETEEIPKEECSREWHTKGICKKKIRNGLWEIQATFASRFYLILISNKALVLHSKK
jgi:hypothetical protein